MHLTFLEKGDCLLYNTLCPLYDSSRDKATSSTDFVACSLQQIVILRRRVLERRDRFQSDSFSESEAKVNCVMFRACVPYWVCVSVHPFVYVCAKPHFTRVSAPVTMPFACVGVGLYGRVKCCRMCGVCVFILCVLVCCIIWPYVGS